MKIMRKIVSVIMAFVMLVATLPSSSISAMPTNYTILDGGQCGDRLYWELHSDGTLRIFGEGKMWDYVKYITPSPWYKYRKEPYISNDGTKILNSDGSEYLPTKDYYADNPNGWYVKKIVIEDGITYIGDWAFYRVCVEEITVPEGVEETGIFCFRYSPTLKIINLPNSLKVLDDFAISRNYVLTTINFGNGLIKIGTAGLNNNPSLESIILPDTVTSINEQLSPTYTGAEINYSNVGLMENCTSLKTVSLGSVDSIPQRTLLGTAIETVIIPNTVSYIGEYAFYKCEALKTVVFEEKSVCTLIKSLAFGGCTSLSSITGGTAIETIEEKAFNGNNGALSEFEFSSSNITFGNTLFYKSGIQYASIGPKVTVIPQSMFQFSAIKELYISKSVTEIQYAAVNSCMSLTDVYYSGTEEEWNAISIAGANTGLNNATIHYNYKFYSCNGYHTRGKWELVQEPTCSESGLQVRKCTVCGEEAESKIIEPLGHIFSVDWVVEKAATCSENGIKATYCLQCDEKKIAQIEKVEHIFGEKKYLVNPTCTQKGRGYHTCEECGYYEYFDEYGEHIYGDWQIITEQTLGMSGMQQRICEECGYIETQTVDASPYKLGDVNNDGSINIVDYNIIVDISNLIYSPTEIESLAADINKDGAVDGYDAIFLQLFINSME